MIVQQTKQKKINDEIVKFKNFIRCKYICFSNLKNRGYGVPLKKGVEISTNGIISIIDLDRTYKIEDLNNLANDFIFNLSMN